MFKISRDVYPDQFWIEIFAYQLGCLMGISVPPAFVAYDSKEEIAGSLIEWFYDQGEDLYVRGGDVMQAMIKDYDLKEGQKHNFLSILDFVKNLGGSEEYWVKQWAEIIIFDALIGNTDRHQGNWGIVMKGGSHLLSGKKIENPYTRMSPPFDNGTSMGHEIYEENFSRFDIASYVNRGKPHLKWDSEQERRTRGNFENFVKRIIQAYPYCKEVMINSLQFTQGQVETIVNKLVCFKINPHLSEARAQFMLNLLFYRQQQLLSILGNEL